jgi:hypothetical protein
MPVVGMEWKDRDLASTSELLVFISGGTGTLAAPEPEASDVDTCKEAWEASVAF